MRERTRVTEAAGGQLGDQGSVAVVGDEPGRLQPPQDRRHRPRRDLYCMYVRRAIR
jgi:hypothetical protein